MGPQYKRSRTKLEIDLTWSCNLFCFNCNRSCAQVPTGERMELEQIHHFIEESKTSLHHWDVIRVLGGEPTLHPEFLKIINLLLSWRDRYHPRTQIQVVSNGYGKKVQEILAKIPAGVYVKNTLKTSQAQPFKSFNIAPIDLPEYANADYTNGCQIAACAGTGLTPYGWYPCPIAGGIDRIFGYNLGYKQMPDSKDDMGELMNKFCRICGHFKRQYEPPLEHSIVSPTWKQAYAQYKETPPSMTRY